MEQKTESNIGNIKLPDFKKPSQEKLDKIKQKELAAIKELGNQCDKSTILGQLERKRLLMEYAAVDNGTQLDYYKTIRNDELVATVTHELTEYGQVLEQIKLIKQSRLSGLIDKYRFDNFETDKQHHKHLMDKARAFLKEPTLCFAALGQVGSGKTHICTALATKLMLEQNRSVKYMIWTNEVERIKFTTDRDERRKLMDTFKQAEVLYIDDLLKVQSRVKSGKNERPIDKIRDADIDVATEIIFDRYINNRMTIISSEHYQDDLLKLDEATASRLIEMSQGYMIDIKRDKNRNERLT